MQIQVEEGLSIGDLSDAHQAFYVDQWDILKSLFSEGEAAKSLRNLQGTYAHWFCHIAKSLKTDKWRPIIAGLTAMEHDVISTQVGQLDAPQSLRENLIEKATSYIKTMAELVNKGETHLLSFGGNDPHILAVGDLRAHLVDTLVKSLYRPETIKLASQVRTPGGRGQHPLTLKSRRLSFK